MFLGHPTGGWTKIPGYFKRKNSQIKSIFGDVFLNVFSAICGDILKLWQLQVCQTCEDVHGPAKENQ